MPQRATEEETNAKILAALAAIDVRRERDELRAAEEAGLWSAADSGSDGGVRLATACPD